MCVTKSSGTATVGMKKAGPQLARLDSDADQTLIKGVEQIRNPPKVEHADQARSRKSPEGKSVGFPISYRESASDQPRRGRRGELAAIAFAFRPGGRQVEGTKFTLLAESPL
jgi:hypothetical protein